MPGNIQRRLKPRQERPQLPALLPRAGGLAPHAFRRDDMLASPLASPGHAATGAEIQASPCPRGTLPPPPH